MVYFWVLLYLHWLTISNENPVSNPILLRMTALFMKKAYKPSVSSFQLLYSVHWHRCFQWLSTYIDCNVLNMVFFWGLLYLHWLTISNEYPVSNPILLRMTALFLRRKLINQAFLLFNYCNLYINIGVFNDCLLTLTVMFSMMVYFWVLLYLHWLTISNEYPVSNPILLRMTALFMKKAYKPSVSSFQLLYSVH